MGLCFSLAAAARGDVPSSVRVFRDAPPARNPTRASRASHRVGPGDRTGPPEDARWPPRASPHPASRSARVSTALAWHTETRRRARRAVTLRRPATLGRARTPRRARRGRERFPRKISSRDSARFAVAFPRRERNATEDVSATVVFRVSRGKEKKRLHRRVSNDDAVALPTDDPPVFPFFSPSPTRRFFLDHLRTPPPRSTRLARAANTRPEKTVVVRLKKTAPAAV